MGVHDTLVYPEIKRLLGIPEDEPIFILRAQDNLAGDTLEFYSDEAFIADCSLEFRDGMDSVQNDFAHWREEHQDKCKKPD